ncbi:MAG: hypothetical protein ACRCXM_17405 [Beijerinckiaceae bacterium]
MQKFIFVFGLLLPVNSMATDKPDIELSISRNELGNATLLSRNENIRFQISQFAEDQKVTASQAISKFSDAMQLQATEDKSTPNLVLFRAKEISQGDSLNPNLAESLGIPSQAIEIMRTTQGWNSGCGGYAFSNRLGKISISYGFVDESLPYEKQNACLLALIFMGFGLKTTTNWQVNQQFLPQVMATYRKILSCEKERENRKENFSSRELLLKQLIACAAGR